MDRNRYRIEFDKWHMPKVDEKTWAHASRIFFGGDSAFARDIIWAVAHGHEAAISIDRLCKGEIVAAPRPPWSIFEPEDGHSRVELRQRYRARQRYKVPHLPNEVALKDVRAEVELGFDRELATRKPNVA